MSAQERGSKEPEESPIYEVIKDGQLVNEATYCNTDEDTLPEAEAEEFPVSVLFYLSLLGLQYPVSWESRTGYVFQLVERLGWQ